MSADRILVSDRQDVCYRSVRDAQTTAFFSCGITLNRYFYSATCVD